MQSNATAMRGEDLALRLLYWMSDPESEVVLTVQALGRDFTITHTDDVSTICNIITDQNEQKKPD